MARSNSKNKIQSKQNLKKKLSLLKRRRKKIVFTNGCFDIIHAGHVRYLQDAKKLGDVLVLALNSDRSVKTIKGSKRPIVPEGERAEIMASLEPIDFVVLFHEPNPYKIISYLEPDVLVKGGDWQPKDIVGSDLVLARGGKVKSIRYHKGKSSTNIIEKILKLYK